MPKVTGITYLDTLVLKFVKAYVATYGVSPSYRQIVNGCHLSTVSSVKRHLERLQAAGHLTHEPGKLRSIRLTDEQNEPMR